MGPESYIRLLKDVPLSPDYADTLEFSTVSAQTDYFMSKTAFTFTDTMYVRNNTIYVPNQAGAYRTCTYCMYTNPDYPNKWFYAFIINVEYLADGTTQITYAEDVIQTWWFEFNIKDCMVQREHVNNDTPGLHLKEEPVAIGDYITNNTQVIPLTMWVLIVGSAIQMSSPDAPADTVVMQGTVSGLAYYIYGIDEEGSTQLRSDLAAIAEAGKSDAVKIMWAVPSFLIGSTGGSGTQLTDSMINNDPVNFNITRPTTLDGYAPRNKKLLTYPFMGLKIGTYGGQNATLRYEFFSGSPSLQYRGTPTPNGRVILAPRSYAGKGVNYDYSIAIGDYPQGSWITDVYANWLATQSIRWEHEGERRAIQGQFEHKKNFISGVVSAVLGDIEGGIRGLTGMIDNAVNYEQNEVLAQNAMAEEREVHSIIPPSINGSVGNDATMQSIGNAGFQIDGKSITASYAKSIDSYFDMFGYRVDTVKKPNITGRQSWNYVQTIGAVVTGNAPLYAKDALRGLLNRGIRFWHNEDIGNYSLPNNIIGG